MSLNNYPNQYYPPERLQEAFLILHPQILERYNITLEQFHDAMPRASNFSNLKYPISDEYGYIYHDSEGYYMAQRFEELWIKAKIAEASKAKGASKKVAYEYEQFMDKNAENRIRFMRNTIREKFNGSKWRNEMLLDTGNREIIEFTYWGDNFFGICDKTQTGRNILGKILMEYRDDLLAQLETYT